MSAKAYDPIPDLATREEIETAIRKALAGRDGDVTFAGPHGGTGLDDWEF